MLVAKVTVVLLVVVVAVVVVVVVSVMAVVTATSQHHAAFKQSSHVTHSEMMKKFNTFPFEPAAKNPLTWNQ